MKTIIPFLFFLTSNALAFDVVQGPTSAAFADTFVNISGDTMTGPLTLAGSSLTVTGSAFSVGTSTFVVTGGKVVIGADSQTVTSNLEIVNNGVIPYLSLYRNGIVAWRIQPTVATGKDLIFDPANGAAQNVIFNNSAGALSVGIGTTSPASKVDISSGTIRMAGTGAPTTGGALCLNSAGAMAKCTSAIDASGNCTCP